MLVHERRGPLDGVVVGAHDRLGRHHLGHLRAKGPAQLLLEVLVPELERATEERQDGREVHLALLHDEIAVGEHPDDRTVAVDHGRGVDVAFEQCPHRLLDAVVGSEREHVRRHDVPHGRVAIHSGLQAVEHRGQLLCHVTGHQTAARAEGTRPPVQPRARGGGAEGVHALREQRPDDAGQHVARAGRGEARVARRRHQHPPFAVSHDGGRSLEQHRGTGRRREVAGGGDPVRPRRLSREALELAVVRRQDGLRMGVAGDVGAQRREAVAVDDRRDRRLLARPGARR